MNCNQVHELCSALYEAELEPELRREAVAHLQQCEPCSLEYSSFGRATDSLRGLEPRGASNEYVQSIMAAVESSAEPRLLRGPRRVASHVAALLVGAAAVALVWFMAPLEGGLGGGAPERVEHAELASIAEPSPPKIDPTPPLGSDAGAAREAPPPLIIEVPVELIIEVPVEKIVVKTQRDPALLHATNRLSLAFGAMQRAFESRPLPEEPQVIVERIPRASYTRAVDRLAFSIELLHRTLEREQQLADLRSTLALEHSPSEEEPLVAPAASSHPSTPVRIRREWDRLVLHTYGPAEDIVPALIAHLDDPDSEVRELVWRELDSIRSELTPRRRPASPQAVTTSDPLESLADLLRTRPPNPKSFDRPGRQQWLDWWNSHGLAALGSEVL